MHMLTKEKRWNHIKCSIKPSTGQIKLWETKIGTKNKGMTQKTEGYGRYKFSCKIQVGDF